MQVNFILNDVVAGAMVRQSLVPAAILGVLAYIASVAATWYYIAEEQTAQFAVEVSEFHLAIWYHYSANYVGIVESVSGSPGLTTGGVDLIAETSGAGLGILYVFPVVACGVAGTLATALLRGGYASGASIAIGYTVAMVIGAFAFSMRETAFGITARFGPSYTEALIFGAVIAAVAGGLGGLLQGIVTG